MQLTLQIITGRIIVTILHLQKQKSATPLSFIIGLELTILKKIFFELLMFLIVKDRNSSITIVFLAVYKMILTLKTIEAFSH